MPPQKVRPVRASDAAEELTKLADLDSNIGSEANFL